MRIPEPKLRGLEAEAERSFPEAWSVVRQEPGVASAINATGLTDNVARVAKSGC
jgi:hypothetical protein